MINLSFNSPEHLLNALGIAIDSLNIEEDKEGWWKIEGGIKSLMKILYRLSSYREVKNCIFSECSLRDDRPSTIYLRETEQEGVYEIMFWVNTQH